MFGEFDFSDKLLEGSYNDIPVYEYLPGESEIQYILALNLAKAVQVCIGEPITDIRPLVAREICQILDNNPDMSKKEPLLRVNIEVSHLILRF